MLGIERLVPYFDGSGGPIWMGGPGEGFWVFVGFDEEASDIGYGLVR